MFHYVCLLARLPNWIHNWALNRLLTSALQLLSYLSNLTFWLMLFIQILWYCKSYNNSFEAVLTWKNWLLRFSYTLSSKKLQCFFIFVSKLSKMYFSFSPFNSVKLIKQLNGQIENMIWAVLLIEGKGIWRALYIILIRRRWPFCIEYHGEKRRSFLSLCRHSRPVSNWP